MSFFGLGPGELLLVMLLALIVFGPGKLPEIGQGMGRAIREFRKATDSITQEISRELKIDVPLEEPRREAAPAPAPAPAAEAPQTAEAAAVAVAEGPKAAPIMRVVEEPSQATSAAVVAEEHRGVESPTAALEEQHAAVTSAPVLEDAPAAPVAEAGTQPVAHVVCSACHAENLAGNRYCGSCGSKLT